MNSVNNAISFTNSFLEYLLVFGISVVVVIIACVIGVALRKRKNAKIEAESVDAPDVSAEQKEALEEQ